MIKSIMIKIYRPIQNVFTTRQKKRNRQKMMAAYLKIKGNKFCAVYNKGLRYE